MQRDLGSWSTIRVHTHHRWPFHDFEADFPHRSMNKHHQVHEGIMRSQNKQARTSFFLGDMSSESLGFHPYCKKEEIKPSPMIISFNGMQWASCSAGWGASLSRGAAATALLFYCYSWTQGETSRERLERSCRPLNSLLALLNISTAVTSYVIWSRINIHKIKKQRLLSVDLY